MRIAQLVKTCQGKWADESGIILFFPIMLVLSSHILVPKCLEECLPQRAANLWTGWWPASMALQTHTLVTGQTSKVKYINSVCYMGLSTVPVGFRVHFLTTGVRGWSGGTSKYPSAGLWYSWTQSGKSETVLSVELPHECDGWFCLSILRLGPLSHRQKNVRFLNQRISCRF
jgi:hypothetical protein